MEAFRRGPIERIIRRLERHPSAVVTMASLSLRFSKDWMRVRAGMIDGAEFRRRGFTHVGSVSGGLAGGAAGALAGTALAPGLGTVLGAFAGSIVGDEAGTRFGRAAVEHAEVRLRRLPLGGGRGPRRAPDRSPVRDAAEESIVPPGSSRPRRRL